MRSAGSITPGFGNGNEAEFWTKEKLRGIQFTQIENYIMDNEVKNDYLAVLASCRIYLRLLMELMVEDQTDPETGKRKKVYGLNTRRFKDMKNKMELLEDRLRSVARKNTDPGVQSNNETEKEILMRDIKSFIDDLFFINTELGTNYRRKDVYEAWKE